MIFKKLLFLLIPIFLFSANLVNVNFFEEKNKLDVLFSLDNKFNGQVKKINDSSFIITNIKTDRVVQKEFNKKFVNSITILSIDNGIRLDILANEKFNTSVALTPDEFGLRFRIKKLVPLDSNQTKPEIQFATSQQKLDLFSYIIGTVILFLIAIFLWFLKKKAISLPITKENMKILVQKPIDTRNKVVLFEYQNKKYLMLIGNTNVLLDVFADGITIPKNETQFDEFLKLSKKYDNIQKYIKNAERLKGIDEKN